MSENKVVTKGLGIHFFALLFTFLTFLTPFAFAEGETAGHGHEDHAAEVVENSHSDADHSTKEETFNAGEMIMHHVSDAHQIHFLTLKADSENPFHLALNLPIILWTRDGLKVFGGGKFYHNEHHNAHGHYYYHDGLVMEHEKIYYGNEDGVIETDTIPAKEEGGEPTIKKLAPMDFSITKSIVGLFLTGLICILIFLSVARSYRKRGNASPKGLQSWMEPLVIFVRDEIAIPSIGPKKADKFTPFLLTIFFFIWVANLLGLIPFLGAFNVMGTMAITLVLAVIVFIITTINGNRHYWMHISWPPGVPHFVKIILVPIEIAGIFIKPAVLMVRLTANITAGHIIILAFTALIFIFGQNSAALGYGVGIGSTAFMIFMFFIELLVAFLQAYVFTLLSALYFGTAVEEAHH